MTLQELIDKLEALKGDGIREAEVVCIAPDYARFTPDLVQIMKTNSGDVVVLQ